MTEAQPAQTTEINDGLHRTNVAVFGLDRPGIVAVVSNALTRRGVNLEQVNQMALHGQFALMCVIQKPAGLSNEQIQQELEAEIARRKFDLAVMVIDFKAPTPQPESEPYVVSVWGTDRNDIIANFSRIFAEQKINIESLRAFPIEDGMSLQVFEVSIPLNVDRRALHRFAQRNLRDFYSRQRERDGGTVGALRHAGSDGKKRVSFGRNHVRHRRRHYSAHSRRRVLQGAHARRQDVYRHVFVAKPRHTRVRRLRDKEKGREKYVRQA